MRKDSGFTLVEVIVVLMIMGILATFVILLLGSGVEGYLFAKQNSVLSQKVGITMSRLTKELSNEMKEITILTEPATTTSPITYIHIKYKYQYTPSGFRHIALVGTGDRRKIVIVDRDTPLPSDSDIEVLIDQVESFTMAFKKYDNSQSKWVDWILGDEMDSLGKIIINMTIFLSPDKTDTKPFSTTITPNHFQNAIGRVDYDFTQEMKQQACYNFVSLIIHRTPA